MWAKYGKFYYPGEIVSLETVSSNVRRKLPTTQNKYVWREQFLSNSKGKENVKFLAQNQIDKARAEQSAKIGKKYLLALA